MTHAGSQYIGELRAYIKIAEVIQDQDLELELIKLKDEFSDGVITAERVKGVEKLSEKITSEIQYAWEMS